MTLAHGDRPAVRPRRVRGVAVACSLMAALPAGAHRAAADHHEATVTVRSTGGVGRFTEDVTGDARGATVSTYGGGGEIGAGYGVSNRLDVGAELAAAGFTQATYDAAKVTIMGVPVAGRVTRRTRLAQLRAGATLRLGVAWVPIWYLGVGLSARMPAAAILGRDERGNTLDLTPDGMAAGAQLDVCATTRIGLERRIDRRWSAGVAAEATHTLGLGAPPIDVVSAGISLSYTWYPGWW